LVDVNVKVIYISRYHLYTGVFFYV
jgi:hypothetical protein